MCSSDLEPDAGALCDENFWLPGDPEYTAPELVQIPGSPLGIPLSEMQVDDQVGSSTLSSQQMISTSLLMENEPLTFDSPVDSESSLISTIELPRQPTPRPSLSISTMPTTSL